MVPWSQSWRNTGSVTHYHVRFPPPVYGLSQWETTLHCNIISHWLSAYPELSHLTYLLTYSSCSMSIWKYNCRRGICFAKFHLLDIRFLLPVKVLAHIYWKRAVISVTWGAHSQLAPTADKHAWAPATVLNDKRRNETWYGELRSGAPRTYLNWGKSAKCVWLRGW